jgi:hypothetical protein
MTMFQKCELRELLIRNFRLGSRQNPLQGVKRLRRPGTLNLRNFVLAQSARN